jgi:phosphatidylserine/phosphatidylglycerophosphate/cardiolipin synthase-like enzyme
VRRTIATTTQQSSRQIRDLLQSLLIAELLDPSSRIWLVSAWIVDAPVIDNRGAEVGSLVPAWPEREVLLSEVLAQLLLTGTRLTVATNDHPANQPFPQALRRAALALDAEQQLRIDLADEVVFQEEHGLHRKRLVTDRAVLWGSMNFTRSGYERNAEDVSLDLDPELVATAVNEMEQLYPTAGQR